MLIDHMTDGYSVESFAAVVNTSIESVYQWCKMFPSFADAKRVGHARSLRKWEKHLQESTKKPAAMCNNAATIYLMKCRFRKQGYMPEDPLVDNDDALDFNYDDIPEKKNE